ncbi:PIN-like domain-containing protein [Gaoshiqia sediminis]|uniref:PIN-like domain-containing protein n=1 Tax=Gaoshiqia sediminis TaxID=2986998 RepID=A0AA41Y9E3_9BACT|nr:PIN-like domain-containing protein [Gaoshiqia sediminis]MCW0484569.1 PIN-like domain-containing protein [Gaoshiqia sediminis]
MQNYNKYQLPNQEEDALIKNAIIVFDTSSILDFYYYSTHTQEEIFKTVFNKIKNRLWLPFQVYFEYMKNREKVMTKPIESYKNLLIKNSGTKDSGHFDEILSIVKKFQKEEVTIAKGQLKTLIQKTQKNDKHPYFEEGYFDLLEKRIELLENYLLKTDKELNEFRQKLESDIENKVKLIESIKDKDPVKVSIEKYFKIGLEFNYTDLIEIIKEGEFRYKNEIPPGYEDFDEKTGFQKYGDLIFWKQILKFSEEQKKPVILVTNDNKKDWWHFDGNRNLKIPRHELISEFFSVNENGFWMYNSNDFLFKIKEILKLKIEDKALEEVNKVYRAKSHEFDDSAIGDWIFHNYDSDMMLTFEGNEKDGGLDFLLATKESKNHGFSIYKGRGSRYTSLLKPIQAILFKKEKIIESYFLERLTQIIVCRDKLQAESIAAHLVRKNPAKLLRQNENDFNLIIGYTNEDGDKFYKIADSNDDTEKTSTTGNTQ